MIFRVQMGSLTFDGHRTLTTSVMREKNFCTNDLTNRDDLERYFSSCYHPDSEIFSMSFFYETAGFSSAFTLNL